MNALKLSAKVKLLKLHLVLDTLILVDEYWKEIHQSFILVDECWKEIHQSFILVDEYRKEIHQSFILVDEYWKEIHQSFILVDECWKEIHQSFILVDEYWKEIHQSFILVDEYWKEIHQLFLIAIAFLSYSVLVKRLVIQGFYQAIVLSPSPDIYNHFIDLEVSAVLLAGLVQHPNPMLALSVPQLSPMLTV